MEAHGLETRSRARKRKPLADLTNAISVPLLSTSSLKPRSLKANQDETSLRFDTSSIGSSKPENPRDSAIDPASTPRPKEASANSDAVDCEKSEIFSTYTRQSTKRRKSKGKAVVPVMQSSCPPLGRPRSLGANLKTGYEAIGQPKPCSVPQLKPKKKRCYKMPEDVDIQPLPQDFIERQNAYFAEIDAFKLSEEEVSESELD